MHAVLRSALADAVREGLLQTNAAVNATVPRATRPRVNPWQPEELGQFLDHAAQDRYGPLFELIALAGLRRGEALGLRWSDVNLGQGYLVIRQQVIQIDGGDFTCAVCLRHHKGLHFAPRPPAAKPDAWTLGQSGVGVLLAQRLAKTPSAPSGARPTATTT